MKNIDTAFRHIKTFSLFLIVACLTITVYALYASQQTVRMMQQKIYILANGKILEAFASERKENVPVEARDHVRMFHYYFFTLDPDEKVVQANITKALYLADNSAKQQYDALKENAYYVNLISGNISQEISFDSVQVDINNYPFYFKCFAKEKIIRPTTIITRNLVSEGYLRNVERSDNNPHGFLVEKWKILDNHDLKTENRDR
ncbi:conjugative transposon protein TraK [Panacibacter ginsenosidivorans]|nr:conjugative transposon protein TraK [Panacibacter ginsenosidivorans]